MMNNQQKAEEYAAEITAELFMKGATTIALHDALTNAVLYGMKQHDYMVREKLWEGMTPFLDADENLVWKEVEQPTAPPIKANQPKTE